MLLVRVQILREEGVRGFYRGVVTNLLRTTPAAIITFTSFELILRHLNSMFPSTAEVQPVDTSPPKR